MTQMSNLARTLLLHVRSCLPTTGIHMYKDTRTHKSMHKCSVTYGSND